SSHRLHHATHLQLAGHSPFRGTFGGATVGASPSSRPAPSNLQDEELPSFVDGAYVDRSGGRPAHSTIASRRSINGGESLSRRISAASSRLTPTSTRRACSSRSRPWIALTWALPTASLVWSRIANPTSPQARMPARSALMT